MARAAHITSLDAIRSFRQELCHYASVVREILEGLGIEMRRAQDWLEHDRTQYWPRATRRAEDGVVAARSELQLAKMAAMSNEHKSCVDEQKMVEQSVRRLRLCEEKSKLVKQWRHAMQHQVDEFLGRMNKLVHYLETDIPRAIAALDRVIEAVERYTETRAAGSKPRSATRHEILDSEDEDTASSTIEEG